MHSMNRGWLQAKQLSSALTLTQPSKVASCPALCRKDIDGQIAWLAVPVALICYSPAVTDVAVTT